MELPLTEPCPECGADMEPRQLTRHRRGIEYVCPECGYETDGYQEPPAAGTSLTLGRENSSLERFDGMMSEA